MPLDPTMDAKEGEDRPIKHAACSILTGYPAPTLEKLKQHAQALLYLIQTVQPVSENLAWSDGYDFLTKFEEVYKNGNPSHQAPLPFLIPDAHLPKLPAIACAVSDANLSFTTLNLPALTEHANDALELIDDHLASRGGLLSLLEDADPDILKIAQTTLLGQWLVYTANLSERLVETEQQTAHVSRLMTQEAEVPWAMLAQQGGAPSGRPLLWPQDRYVLHGLSPELWRMLDEKLSAEEKNNLVSAAKAKDVLHGGPTKIPVHSGEGLQILLDAKQGRVLSWTDVTARLVRVSGEKTIFINLCPPGMDEFKEPVQPPPKWFNKPAGEDCTSCGRRARTMRVKRAEDSEREAKKAELDAIKRKEELEDEINELGRKVMYLEIDLEAARKEMEELKADRNEENMDVDN